MTKKGKAKQKKTSSKPKLEVLKINSQDTVHFSVPNRVNNFKLLLATSLSVLGLLYAIILAIPLFLGVFQIIFTDKQIPSSLNSIQLSLVASALGAIIIWFHKDNKKDNKLSVLQNRGTMALGVFMLFSAMCFALFALMCPIFPDALEAKDTWSVIIKWSGFLTLMAGSVSLGLSLCVGIFEVWTWVINNED